MTKLRALARRVGAYIDRVDERKLTRAILLATFALCCMRLVNLDVDLPGTGISFSLAIDEGLYSKQALNYYEYGSWRTSGDFIFDTGDSYKAIVIGNLLQIVSMQVFGDTYFAFRLPYVLIGLATIFLMLILVVRCLRRFCPQKKIRIAVLVGVCILFIFDFPLQLITRLVESSVTRMFGIALMLLVWTGMDTRPRLKNFLLGFIGTCSVFFIYFSNLSSLFVLLMYGIWLLARRDWAAARSLAFWSILGILAASALAEVYYLAAWDQEAYSTLVAGIGSFSQRLSSSITSSSDTGLIFYFKNGMKYWVSNMFFYNATLLGLTLVALPLNAWYAVKHRSDDHFLAVAFIAAVFIQAIIADDWVQRKAIVSYPAVILNAVLFLGQLLEVWLPAWRRRTLRWRASSAAAVGVVYLGIVYSMFRFRQNGGYFEDYTEKQLMVVSVFVCLQACIFCALLVYAVIMPRPHGKHASTGLRLWPALASICCGAVLSVACSAAFDWEFIYGDPTYTEKEAMIEIGEYLGDSYVCDPISFGYLLYNDVKPVNGDAEYITELFEEGAVIYMIDYALSPAQAYNYVEREDITLVASFYRRPTAWGYQKDIGIFISSSLIESESGE